MLHKKFGLAQTVLEPIERRKIMPFPFTGPKMHYLGLSKVVWKVPRNILHSDPLQFSEQAEPSNWLVGTYFVR